MSTGNTVYSCIVIYYIIFHMNNYKPTFASPCSSNYHLLLKSLPSSLEVISFNPYNCTNCKVSFVTHFPGQEVEDGSFHIMCPGSLVPFN